MGEIGTSTSFCGLCRHRGYNRVRSGLPVSSELYINLCVYSKSGELITGPVLFISLAADTGPPTSQRSTLITELRMSSRLSRLLFTLLGCTSWSVEASTCFPLLIGELQVDLLRRSALVFSLTSWSTTSPLKLRPLSLLVLRLTDLSLLREITILSASSRITPTRLMSSSVSRLQRERGREDRADFLFVSFRLARRHHRRSC